MAQSIVAGVDGIINDALSLNRARLKYQHKELCQRFTAEPPTKFDAQALIRDISAPVEANWHQRKSSSNENWRWTKNTNIDATNRSPEVILERWIARTADEDWANQVPVASGVTAKAGGRRAIDLVHRCGKGRYELIELKADEGGGTPLFAAMEILQYGVLYMFSRENAQKLQNRSADKGLFDAVGIHLKVLAPADYYQGYDLSWLEKALNAGLASHTKAARCGFKMDFQFESLSLVPVGSRVRWKAKASPRVKR